METMRSTEYKTLKEWNDKQRTKQCLKSGSDITGCAQRLISIAVFRLQPAQPLGSQRNFAP